MAKAKNTFLGAKMNKDIDARLLQDGNYRDALNVQVSRSEGDSVGSLENVLGNSLAVDISSLTGVIDLTCIGYFADDVNNIIYLFLTDYTDQSPSNYIYNKDANNFIYAYNTVSKVSTKLVEGAFLNFSKTNYIYGVNVLEDLLFWTDNRNQPRKINTTSAFGSSTYYQTEDQISVSTYNPYQSILLFRQSLLASNEQYETTMLDVTSKFYPNGGLAIATAGVYVANTAIPISNIRGNIYIQSELKTSTTPTIIPSATRVVEIDNQNPPTFIKLNNDVTIDSTETEIVFEPNPYFESSYNGDPNYLENKFVRFGYRFNYIDGENSIFSPFTQPAFIPKQDGYFMTDKSVVPPVAVPLDPLTTLGESYASREKNDQELSYQSTIVEFMENKVNKILLYIPLPFNNYDLQTALKVDSIDILYKESNQTAVKIIEQVSAETIFNSSATATLVNNVPNSVGPFAIENVKGGIQVGSQITFPNSTGIAITVTAWEPSNIANPIAGNITLSSPITQPALSTITIGNPSFYIYDYQSRKPFRVLPESDLIRVYDKTPVRSLAQEVISNRVVYGNFQNKHTPPAFLDYNVSASPKAAFTINSGSADVIGGGVAGKLVEISPTGFDSASFWKKSFTAGSIITSSSTGAVIPTGTRVVSTNNDGTGVVVSASVIVAVAGSTIAVSGITGFIPVGATVTGAGIAAGTTVVAVQEPSPGVYSVLLSQGASVQQAAVITFTLSGSTDATITLSNNVTLAAGDIIELNPAGDIQDATSIIEYPNHSVKQNRNYQVGFVLSDRYGRQSSVILSNSLSSVFSRGVEFKGSTIYSAYNSDSVIQSEWPGNSLKVSFNSSIGPVNKNTTTGWPGLYNGDPDSEDYNPLGWYSWKIVVKQTEQEYYNVYLPGIMASYPNNTTLELGKTSHTVLINDNINKIPRDLSQVGPQQKQFRSSVEVYGRVENNVGVVGTVNLSNNRPYYPGIKPDTVSIISTLNDLFDFSPLVSERPDFFPQFYSYNSDPLIARISTENKVGQIASTDLITGSGIVDLNLTPPSGGTDNQVTLADIQGTINNGMLVRGGGLAEGTKVIGSGLVGNIVSLSNDIGSGSGGSGATYNPSSIFRESDVLTFFEDPEEDPLGLQYLAVYETQAVDSLLDIFWETSSNGLISELNEAVLSENVGAFELVGFNDILFFEDLTIGSDIIDGLGMTAQDVFGNDIPAADFDIELVSPSGGFAITDATGADRTQDFDLVETSTPGFYQIKTSSLFVFLADSAPREFNFNFRITNISTGSTSFFSEDAQLRNVKPEIINCLSTPGYLCENGSVVPQVVINQSDSIVLNKIEGKNGSAFFSDGTTGANGNKFEGGKGLQFEIVGQVRTNLLTTCGGPVTEQNALDGVVFYEAMEGLSLPLPEGPFTMDTTSATSNLINNGVTFATLNKPDVTQPIFLGADIAKGYQDWAVYVQITDASGAIGSLSDPTLCRIIVRINYSLIERDFYQPFITPRALATGADTYIDATAEVVAVVNTTRFEIKNLSGDNVYFGLSAGINLQGTGPIYTTGTAFADAVTLNPEAFNNGLGPAGDQIYSTNLQPVQGEYNTQLWYVPNAKVLGGSVVGDNPRVESVDYIDADFSDPFSQVDFGTTAFVNTFTPHNVTAGDIISFTSGRWLVTAPGNTGQSYTQPIFPRQPFGPSAPYISPTTGDPLTQQEMCGLVINGSPMKTPQCQFVQGLTEREDQIPENPFSFIVSLGIQTGVSGMIPPGSEYGGTVNGCNEDCQPG